MENHFVTSDIAWTSLHDSSISRIASMGIIEVHAGPHIVGETLALLLAIPPNSNADDLQVPLAHGGTLRVS